MSINRGPNIVTDGLVFGYDADDRSRFYKGEPTTNLYSGPSSPALYFTSAYNGNYGFGSNTNIQTNIDNSDQFIANLNVQKISRINSDVSQFDYIEWTSIISRGFTTTFQPNEIRTVSFYYKGTFGTILNPYIGNSGTLLLYSDNAISGNGTTNIRIPVITNEWQRVSFRIYNSSSTSTSVFGYGWMVLHQNQFTTILNNTEYWKFTGIQVELKSHPTQFVTGTRGATESLIDLKKTTTIDVSNVSFDSTAHPTFDGINDVIRTTYAPQLGDFTICLVFKDEGSGSWGRIVDKSYTDGVFISSQFASGGANYIGAGIIEPNPPHGQSLPYTPGKYHFFTVVRSGTTHKIYLDGITQTLSKTGSSALLSTTAFAFGSWSAYNNQMFKGKLPIVKIYNKALSDTEVLQNYNAYKKRFNL